MSAGAYEIQVVVARMNNVWAQVAQLGEIVAQPESRSVHQIQIAFVFGGSERLLGEHAPVQIAQAKRRQAF
jgi:hypothetical protein